MQTKINFSFIYRDPIVPSTRMTTAGKYIKKSAQRYIKSQRRMHLLMLQQFKEQGFSISEAKFKVSGVFAIAKRQSIIDLSNMVKAVEDASQGVVMANDKQIREYGYWQITSGETLAVIHFKEV